MGFKPDSLERVALIYATFPRSTETFVRRELRAMHGFGFKPKLFSIWKGKNKWEGHEVQRFTLLKLCTLFFWLPYWAFKKPKSFRQVLLAIWNKPCPNLQNWNETFLGLGFALVEAHHFRGQRFQLLHAVWATMPATAAFALSELIDVPFSMGAHAYDLFRTGGDWLLNEKFMNASMIRTSSNSSAHRLKAMGVSDNRVKVIRRGLNKWPSRNSFKLTDYQKLKLISVGRLVEKKGYFFLLQILELLKERAHCGFQMTIVGNGPLDGQLRKEIDRLGLAKEVSLAGAKSEDEVSKCFLEYDAMLFTGIIAYNGDRDGIPNVIPEAMSSGTLILSSIYAGASEPFIDGVSGFSLNPKEPHKWVEILEDFAQNPIKYEKVRKKALLEVRERFDVNQTALKLIRNFEKIALLDGSES